MSDREIKFRIWDKELKTYIQPENQLAIMCSSGQLIDTGGYKNNKNEYVGFQHPPDFLDMSRRVIEQFTGILDKTGWEELIKEEQEQWLSSGKTKEQWNGKKIYEGDIVRWCDSDDIVRIDSVTFGRGQFYLCNSQYGIGHYSTPTDPEIIGNIHQSPDLLEGAKT